ncbi:VWA domain-containing protein [Verrucomicrobiota bacterium]
MNLQFVNGWVLFLVWAVPALAFLWFMLFKQKRKAIQSFLAKPMLSKLAPASKPSRFYWQLALVQIGFILILIAAARPQWGMEERTVFQRGRDLIIALDVSRSMLARDVHPNRLLRAKADIQDLLRELRGDRVALIAFRGHAVQLCPLTTDYSFLEQILDGVTVESAPGGETNIGDAIDKALAAFETDEGAHRAMILISDGEDLAGQAKASAERAKSKGIVIFTVGLGDPKGATIPGATKKEPVMTYQGKKVISKLQHETLKEIADITGGAYVPVGVANVKLGRLYSEHLSKITARDIEESLQKRMIERYQIFLLPGILALLAAAFLSHGRLATHKKTPDLSGQPMKTDFTRTAAVKLLLYFMFSALFVCGRLSAQTNAATNTSLLTSADTVSRGMQDTKATNRELNKLPTGREGASKAQGLYRRGAYRQAALAYLHSMSNSNQRLQNDCLFNAGCSFYRAEDYAKALKTFNQLGKREKMENADQSKAYYNLGCATFRIAEQSEKTATNQPPAFKPLLLEKAGNAFQRSLRAKPDVQNAAANLAAITNMLPKAREDAKVKTLMAKYGNQQPAQLADTILKNQRNILKTMPVALTNATPGRIAQFEGLANQQRVNTDLLIPLKTIILKSLSSQGKDGQKQIPKLGQHLDATRNSMNDAFEHLRNIDNHSFKPVKSAEHGVYNLWKGLASFEKLLQEDIRRQTNTIAMTTSLLAEAEGEIKDIQSEQTESLQLTGLFTKRFSQAVPPEGTTAGGKLPGAPSAPLPAEGTEKPSTNNSPKITRETRTNILHLAKQAVKTQTMANRFLATTNIEASLPKQRHSYALLKEIEKLLPKDKNKQNKQQNQKQQQDQKQDKNQKQDNKNKQQPPPKKDQKAPPPKEDKKPKQPKKQPAQPEKKDQKEMSPEQLRSLLEKALQREKDHRKEKKRDEYTPPSPVERDW